MSLDSNKLASIAMKNNTFATISGDRMMLYYEDGVYLPNGIDVLAADVENEMQGDMVTNHLIKEIAGHINRRTFVKRDDFDNNGQVINMANGLYYHNTGISPHTSKYLSLHKSPITYDLNAQCPFIDKFIREVVEPSRVQTIYELVGYALTSKKNLKRAFIFEGEKNSGKSVMIDLLECMVGADATTHVSPFMVSRNTYGAAEYYGKSLNLVDDLGNSAIEDTGVLKSVVGGHKINAQFKYSQPFDYTPNVLCVFATNSVPTTTCIDDAYASRFSIIPFPNTFEGNTDNPDMIELLTTPEELSGFFNKSMDALAELTKRGTFSGDGTLADRIKQYQRSSKPVARFVDEACVMDDNEDSISKEELYGAYVHWSKGRDITTIDTERTMTKYLKELGCVVRNKTGDDGRYYAYCGITLKSAIGDF